MPANSLNVEFAQAFSPKGARASQLDSAGSTTGLTC
jgi:hypothetical protein